MDFLIFLFTFLTVWQRQADTVIKTPLDSYDSHDATVTNSSFRAHGTGAHTIFAAKTSQAATAQIIKATLSSDSGARGRGFTF